MNKHSGFTLVEMMITVAIIGILVRLAYPSYLDTVRKSNRAEAKTELMDISQRLQRCFSAFGKFNDTTNCAVYIDVADTSGYTTRGKGFYKISFSGTPSATTYTLQAVAQIKPQLTDKDKSSGTSCSTMTLDEKGNRSPSVCW